MQPSQRSAWREQLYVVIFEADTRAGQLLDIALMIAILASVTAVSLETIDSIGDQYGAILKVIEWSFTLLFTVEYILRLISVRRSWAYARSFYGLVDLVSILPTYITPWFTGASSFSVVRSFRLLRVFRILKLFHLTRESEVLAEAVWRSRLKIVVFLTVVLITVTIAGTAMYEVENFGRSDQSSESQFTSIPQAVYWAVVTMTTVGYGDIVPQTAVGKLVSAALILIGYSLIIVPSGFVSAEIIDVKRTPNMSNQTCPHCMAEGHLKDAIYCRKCGKLL